MFLKCVKVILLGVFVIVFLNMSMCVFMLLFVMLDDRWVVVVVFGFIVRRWLVVSFLVNFMEKKLMLVLMLMIFLLGLIELKVRVMSFGL